LTLDFYMRLPWIFKVEGGSQEPGGRRQEAGARSQESGVRSYEAMRQENLEQAIGDGEKTV
jgi:hypothetical protein